MINIQRITTHLPLDFQRLRADARSEGFRFMDVLAAEWEAESDSFAREGEMLLAIFIYDEIAGIGGLTHDPIIPKALRMRRFYVRPDVRGHGIGRVLVDATIASVAKGQVFTAHAGTPDAVKFWDTMKFSRSTRAGITHEKICT